MPQSEKAHSLFGANISQAHKNPKNKYLTERARHNYKTYKQIRERTYFWDFYALEPIVCYNINPRAFSQLNPCLFPPKKLSLPMECIFCKIIKGDIPAKKLYEDDEMIAFHDAAPMAPVHFLVVPKTHIKNIMECGPDDAGLIGRLLVKAQELAIAQGCGEKGARFIINCKTHGGQTVDHLHIHTLAGRPLSWPPG
jgi:histidine triad (HIT) family protein